MTVPACHCEARKAAYRQSKEGLVVSFVIHPNDMPDALAVAPLGQRYMLALAAIGDDEQAIETEGSSKRDPQAGAMPATSPASQRGKNAYATATEAGRAITRAAILCADPKFRFWLTGGEHITTEAAAQMIREACGVDSRKEFDHNPEALRKFQAIDTEYKLATNQMAEVRR